MKSLRYLAEALLVKLLLLFFSVLPPALASHIGGFLGRIIGPRLATSRKALRNVERALPDADADQVIGGMWGHLGRVMAEYPHLEHLAHHAVEIAGHDILEEALDDPNGAIFFGAHLGQWELNAACVIAHTNHPIDITYRAPNNPYVDKILMDARSMHGQVQGHAKSSAGGKSLMKRLKDGVSAGILIDQKYNEGINVPFFGMEAMTNPVFVQLAQKYGCRLVPIRNERLDGATFRLNVYEPIAVFHKDGSARAVEDVIAEAHTMIEQWITERPEQWLWLHRRWKD